MLQPKHRESPTVVPFQAGDNPDLQIPQKLRAAPSWKDIHRVTDHVASSDSLTSEDLSPKPLVTTLQFTGLVSGNHLKTHYYFPATATDLAQ